MALCYMLWSTLTCILWYMYVHVCTYWTVQSFVIELLWKFALFGVLWWLCKLVLGTPDVSESVAYLRSAISNATPCVCPDWWGVLIDRVSWLMRCPELRVGYVNGGWCDNISYNVFWIEQCIVILLFLFHRMRVVVGGGNTQLNAGDLEQWGNDYIINS